MSESCIAVLGMFDGVHIGHQTLLKYAVKLKEETGFEIKVVTFQIHPKQVIGQSPDMLCTNDEKNRLCMEFGADEVVFLPFDETMRTMLPGQFVKTYLIEKLKANHVVVGENFRFGFLREGTPETLTLFEEFQTHVIPTVYLNGEIVCSTKIRSLLMKGELEYALNCLGHDLIVSGTVEKGRGLGNTLGFPTANLTAFFPPLAHGVYITETLIEDEWFPSVSNFGTVPTFLNGSNQVLETHFLTYNESIYGKTIRVRFLKLIREERKFSCKEQLIEQIQKDKECAKHYFSCL